MAGSQDPQTQTFWPMKHETEAHRLGFGPGCANQSAHSVGSAHWWVDVIFDVVNICNCVRMGETYRKAELKN